VRFINEEEVHNGFYVMSKWEDPWFGLFYVVGAKN